MKASIFLRKFNSETSLGDVELSCKPTQGEVMIIPPGRKVTVKSVVHMVTETDHELVILVRDGDNGQH